MVAATPTDTLAINTITVPITSATLASCLPGGVLNAACKKVTLRPVSDIYAAIGAATAGANVLAGNFSHEMLCKATTDLQLIASGSTVSCVVFQEG